jgi:CheY-like chemotaxis protein
MRERRMATILVVDDDQDICALLRLKLEISGYTVEAFAVFAVIAILLVIVQTRLSGSSWRSRA